MCGVGAAHLARLVFGLSAQLECEFVDVVEDLCVELFGKARVAGEAARIEALHFLDEGVYLAGRLRIVLQLLAQLAQFLDVLLEVLLISLIDVALQVARNQSCAGRYRLGQLGIVAGVDVAVPGRAAAIASAERCPEAAAGTIAVGHAAGLIVAAASLC